MYFDTKVNIYSVCQNLGKFIPHFYLIMNIILIILAERAALSEASLLSRRAQTANSNAPSFYESIYRKVSGLTSSSV